MILLTGSPGIGKTTLLQKILSEVDNTIIVGNLTFTQDHGRSVLPWVLHAFGLSIQSEGSPDMFHMLSDYFSSIYRNGKGILLVVDEAQNLDIPQLEELRLLFNLNDREGPVLQLVLAGHPQLREQLKDPRLAAFVQRIGTDFSLESLTVEDTMAYIRHRLLVAGGSASLFSEKACGLVYRYSQGIPRLINQLCEASLIYGFSEQVSRITDSLVSDAATDRQLSGLYSEHDKDRHEAHVNEAIPNGEPAPVATQIVDVSHGDGTVQSANLRFMRDESLEPNPGTQDIRNRLSSVTQRKTTSVSFNSVELVRNPDKYWEEGLKLRDEGWCLEAIQQFKRAAMHSRYHTSSWFQIGQCYLVLGKRAEALKSFRNSLSNPQGSEHEVASIQYAMGQVLEDVGQMEEAQRYYELAAATDPTFEPDLQSILQLTARGGTAQTNSRSSWVKRLLRFLWK
ncbi:MAG: AAA family ATPase [Nitrospirales bacterium]|nr:AAA family ATPase [Nitrospira sp.]MDR4502067.1 AAA family ATPase [Nitrospirales bacterium]